MTSDQAPRLSIPFPEIGVPTMHPFASKWRIAGRLHCLCTHNNGNITINTNMFDTTIERGVMSQTLPEDIQNDTPVRCNLVSGRVYYEMLRPYLLKHLEVLVEHTHPFLLLEGADRLLIGLCSIVRFLCEGGF